MITRAIAALGLVGVVVLLVFAAVRGDDDEPVVAAGSSDSRAPSVTAVREPIPVLREVPELVGNESWYNAEPTTMDEIYAANVVTIVQFWTFGCSNCKATLDNLQALYSDYGDTGLEIVGIHAPEFSYERDPANVEEALPRLGVTWPVTLDQEKRNFHRWQPGRTGYWPRTFVVDSEGNIRFDHIGEGKYQALRDVVEQLLDEA